LWGPSRPLGLRRGMQGLPLTAGTKTANELLVCVFSLDYVGCVTHQSIRQVSFPTFPGEFRDGVCLWGEPWPLGLRRGMRELPLTAGTKTANELLVCVFSLDHVGCNRGLGSQGAFIEQQHAEEMCVRLQGRSIRNAGGWMGWLGEPLSSLVQFSRPFLSWLPLG
jgi:hypothetical protein